MSDIDFNKVDEDNIPFIEALSIIEHTNQHVYLTGKAGTGKTTFLNYIRQNVKKEKIILAPTGIAAINAVGQTIHSFFSIQTSIYVPCDRRLRLSSPPEDPDKTTIYDHFQYRQDKLEVMRAAELLIIDEVSMLRCDVLDTVDTLLRVFRKNFSQPFGGVQVLLIGDLFQLPPVAPEREWDILREFYDTPFFFSARVMEESRPICIELNKVYRQKDPKFINLLNAVRENKVSQEDIDTLNSRFNPTFIEDDKSPYITLTTHNRQADLTNITKLDRLKTDLHTFEAHVEGIFPESSMPVSQFLQLKEGAQIMFLTNNYSRGYYNGKIAQISKITDDSIIVKINGDQEIILEKYIWENKQYTWNKKEKKIEEKIIGTFTQFPIRLAWAITVHKSQGLTFDNVIADLGNAFAPGQVYVALSRCTSLEGLVLRTRITPDIIKTDRRVIKFHEENLNNKLAVKTIDLNLADIYYAKARNDLKSLDFTGVYENIMKAIIFRNDINTDLFKRYFVSMGHRLASFQQYYLKVLEDLRLSEENEQKLHRVIAEEKRIQHRHKIQMEQQESHVQQLKKEIDDLNYRVGYLNTKIIQSDQNAAQEIRAYMMKSRTKEAKIADLEKIVAQQQQEIEKLKGIKWYQKLFSPD